ncbi:MAG: rRNA maturation RNase YbeY [Chloroflexi bacterium]|nr:rRNA maturation RNase YbeY [Chloroflexota bacterium]
MVGLVVERLEGVDVPLPDEWFARIAQCAADAARAELGAESRAETVLLLAGDETLHSLNREFRGIDRPTDVLSFAQLEDHPREAGFVSPPGEPGAPRHLGDIAISVERARRQAGEYGHSFERELAYLLVHGVLHLLGYDHDTDEDQAAMRQVEESALSAIGLRRDGGAESTT